MSKELLQTNRPRIAVVIGSGGIKPLAGVAVLEFLDSIGVTPDLLVGCSGGGIVCAMRAAGYRPAEIRARCAALLKRKLFDIDYRTLLAIGRLPFGHFDISHGIIKPQKMQAAFRELFGERRIEELDIPLLLQTTDLLKGEGVVLSSGVVADAVYASSAEFPLFPLLCLDGRWLADGEFSSSLPILEAVKRSMDIIIAVRVQTEVATYPKGFNSCLSLLFSNIGKISVKLETPLAISLHHHEIITITVSFTKHIHPWNIQSLPDIITAGEAAVEQKKPEIIHAIETFQAR